MPTAICSNCHRQTNSAVSNYWEQHQRLGGKLDEVVVTKCYAALVGGVWVKGCGFDQADAFEKRFALGLIEKGI